MRFGDLQPPLLYPSTLCERTSLELKDSVKQRGGNTTLVNFDNHNLTLNCKKMHPSISVLRLHCLPPQGQAPLKESDYIGNEL